MEKTEDYQPQRWEQQAIEKIALASIKEQRSGRRWKIFFTFLFFIYLTAIIAMLVGKSERASVYDVLGQKVGDHSHKHIALVRLRGGIADDEKANAARLSKALRLAASKEDVAGILIEANSPGGSPVQSSLVYQTIGEIKAEFDKPIKTVVTDVCASGCYYIVSASDEIYADKSSVVGSIGVISQSLGIQAAAEKLGLEPRIYTAGKNKDFMSPAREPTAEEIAFLEKLLNELHQNFIDAVKTGRGERLSDNPELFSGLFWTGQQAKALGLIDGIATPVTVAKSIGDYPVYDYMQQSPIEQILSNLNAETQRIVSRSIEQLFSPETGVEFK